MYVCGQNYLEIYDCITVLLPNYWCYARHKDTTGVDNIRWYYKINLWKAQEYKAIRWSLKVSERCFFALSRFQRYIWFFFTPSKSKWQGMNVPFIMIFLVEYNFFYCFSKSTTIQRCVVNLGLKIACKYENTNSFCKFSSD